MSALGKPVLEGDFDANGQMVVQTPPERVIERSVVVTRTVETETAGQAVRQSRSVAGRRPRHNGQPPLPYPLAPRPKPADLTLDRARDAPADPVRQGDPDRPLSDAGRKLPGHVRPRLLRLCR